MDMEKRKKLTANDYKKMWGEEVPYSQVRLCEETRILDSSISRVFLVVEAEINPFTFEYVEEHRDKFKNDISVLQLLDYAESRGEFGYVVSAGEVKVEDKGSKEFARKQADMTIETLIRMHKFVINEFNLKQNDNFGIVKEATLGNEKFIWNEEMGKVEPADATFFEKESLVSSISGVQNNKMRYFIMLGFKKGLDFKHELAIYVAEKLKEVSIKFNVEIEEVESFRGYILITSLISFDVVPSDFVESIINTVNTSNTTIFVKDYFISNGEKPTPEEIMTFLGQISL